MDIVGPTLMPRGLFFFAGRRESITATELLAWFKARPGASWVATINDINRALDDITGVEPYSR